ncbi:hypothetical protein [Cohnella lupini]|uniref:hypothetical protein n=1 Tax=Cohnella lupini TaxID=1294267 RepID=UPI0011C023B0|nr:hypothetical protein [Cohnella lupini]
MNITIKELCKQIKKSRYFIWTLVDGVHYLTNRHWAIKYAELPREVLIQLFTKYAAIPEEGKTIIYDWNFGDTVHDKPVNVAKVFDDHSVNALPGVVTAFIKSHNDLNMRVINFDGKYVLVNNEYLKMLNDYQNSTPHGKGMNSAILFNDNTFMVLPYRTTTDTAGDIQLLNDLLVS